MSDRFDAPLGRVEQAILEPEYQKRLEHLPNVAERDLVEQVEAADGTVHRVVFYRFGGNIPSAVTSAIGTDEISWDERSVFDPSDHTWRFEIHPHAARDRFACRGAWVLTSDDEGTARTVTVELQVKVPIVGRIVENAIAQGLREMLEEEGFEVVEDVADGHKAVEAVRNHKPDLAILDIKMPGMDGIRAAEVISLERLSAILILTAFSQRDLAAQAAQAGAMGYLVKPFQKADLLPAIEVALGRFDEMSRLQDEVHDLEDQLEGRKVVEKAKGMLMDEGLSEAEAYRLMQRAAMDRHAKLVEVAQLILDGRLADPPVGG